MALKCEVCDQDIDNLDLGMLSWIEDEAVIKNLAVHHKHSCEIEENKEWIPLYLLHNPKVFCNFIIMFLRKWDRGTDINSNQRIEKIMLYLYSYNMRDLTAKEKRDWIGYTKRFLPLKFPHED